MDVAEARAAINAGQDVADVLRRIWHLLEGGDVSAMAGYKVQRVSKVRWRDPVATFDVERHGDPHGQLQTWRVNLARGTATCVREQPLGPPVVQWDERAIAAELAGLIRAGADDPRLRWRDERRAVKVSTVKTLPPGTRATPDQANALHSALAKELGGEWAREVGWWVRAERN